jgi:hypothetical protein
MNRAEGYELASKRKGKGTRTIQYPTVKVSKRASAVSQGCIHIAENRSGASILICVALGLFIASLITEMNPRLLIVLVR